MHEKGITQPTLIITGPTGVGKTEIAVRLAKRHPFEIISADSMQVYRGLEIGTAQPTARELDGVPIFGCGILDPAERFNVKMFLDRCHEYHVEIDARGNHPLYVGGTGMYLRALRYGLFDEPTPERGGGAETPAATRARLNELLAELGPEALHNRLQQVDAMIAQRISPRDGVRIVRGLEVAELSGRRLSELQREWTTLKPRFPHLLVILSCPRPVLVSRIESRVTAMLESGWVNEVARLLKSGYPPTLHCFKAIGYREVIRHLKDELSASEMSERIKARVRQFSKRQLTWFRRERDAHWVEFDGIHPQSAVDQIEKLLVHAHSLS